MKQRSAVKTAAALLLMMTAVACRGGARRATHSPVSEPVHPVRVARVEHVGGDAVISVPAVVAAQESATLFARIPASVVALPFREGDAVSKGSVVVRLDDSALGSAEAAADAAAKAAEVDLARVQALLSKNAATPRELDEATARAAAARAALAGVRDSRSYAVLRAPFDGVVAARPVHVGDVVSPSTPMLVIEGRTGLEVRATVEAASASRIRRGQRLSTRVDGQAEAVIATVRSISPAADPATHRVEIRADLGAAPGLRSGLFARLLIPAAGEQGRITVPSAAVVERGGLSGVFVVAQDRAWLRWVAMGASEGKTAEVRAGLDPGTDVVLEPAGLDDGARIEVVR
jgi:RND family efflux transporter MFP subunit